MQGLLDACRLLIIHGLNDRLTDAGYKATSFFFGAVHLQDADGRQLPFDPQVVLDDEGLDCRVFLRNDAAEAAYTVFNILGDIDRNDGLASFWVHPDGSLFERLQAVVEAVSEFALQYHRLQYPIISQEEHDQ